eukprot:374059-Rhodomonas_salina.1
MPCCALPGTNLPYRSLLTELLSIRPYLMRLHWPSVWLYTALARVYTDLASRPILPERTGRR